MTYTAPRPFSLRPLGVVQLVLSVVAGGLWLLCAPGVAMCSDGGSKAYCSDVSTSFLALGFLGCSSFVLGVVGVARAPRTRRSSGVLAVAGLIVLGLLSWRTLSFWDLASSPIH